MRIFALVAALLWPALASAGAELLVVERVGCVYCAQFEREVAEIYPKTDEGRIAPLRRVDLDTPLPGDIQLNSKPVITPTFILLVDGKERSRLLGYPGDQFFWYQIDSLMGEAGVSIEPAS